jgi:hypothetical protein
MQLHGNELLFGFKCFLLYNSKPNDDDCSMPECFGGIAVYFG